MGILNLPKRLLGKAFSKGTIFSMVSGYAASKIMERNRKRWEAAKQQQVEALLDQITAYDICRGAGKLVAGWLEFEKPNYSLDRAELAVQQLLARMDEDDHLPEEKACSRLLVSKALFRLEGFKLGRCRYESYQKASLGFIRKNPKYRMLTRDELFHGKPFAPEDLIATTHRMLLMLDDGRLATYLDGLFAKREPRDDTDYMAMLIANTLTAREEDLSEVMSQWFDAYCDFKIDQTHEHEAIINTSLTTATGGLPMEIGMGLLGKAVKAAVSGKKKSS
jgi:hypothetical protein